MGERLMVFRPPPMPDDEEGRIARLWSLKVLDTPSEELFDEIARTAADLCGMPIALVSLVDVHRQWFKANIGLPGVVETPRETSFCGYTILSDELMEVEDATRDVRFCANPHVADEPGVRFYAGAPIVMPGGERLGTLCVIDHQPRKLSAAQRLALSGLGRMVASALLEREKRLSLIGELAASEANYRAIVESQTELVSLSRPDGTLAYVNQAYATFFGGTQAGMTGANLLDFVAEADRHAVRDHLRGVYRGGVGREVVNQVRLADGTIRWVAWANRLLPAQAGRGALIHSVGRDVTEQKLAEEALAASEARLRQLYESTPAMLHSIDLEGRLLSVSDTWLEKLGYERHEVMGRASADFLTPQSRERARSEVLPEFFRTGRIEGVEYQFMRKDGSVIDVLLSAMLERDAEGRPLRSMAVLEDITDRKATAASLREASHTLQMVMDNLPARISYWTPDHRNIFANKSFLKAFGGDPAAIAGRFAWDIMGESWWRRVEATIADAQSGRESHVELAVDGPDGQRRDTELRFKPDIVEGELKGMFVIGMDMTAHRQTERDLAEERRRQQAAAERALAEKETLLKEVYHRVKNNLQVVQSLLNLQRQALPDEGVARAALDDSVQRIRAMALVHEKLYQSGDLSAISLQTYTRDLLRQIADANGTHGRGLSLQADIPDVQTGLDNAIPFGLLLTELVTNTIKHAFKGREQGSVQVTLKPREGGALLTVTDDGVGFEGDLPTVSRTSMGLKLAASLARQLGGELRVGRDGGGTVFEAVLKRL